MTNLLIKMFIKDKENTLDLNVRGKYAMLASITGIIVNILLSIVKLTIGIITGAMSIISDALNNVTDAGSSVVTLIGFRAAQKQSDSDHPWGHGRMEYIAGFIVDLVIILVGIELFRTSIVKIFYPEVPQIGTVTLVLLVIAILTKLWLFLFYKKIAKAIDSSALMGAAYDSISDTISTSAVFVSAIVAKYFQLNIDGYVSLLVAGFILLTGYKATKEMIDILIGKKTDPEFVKDIYEFVKSYPEIVGIHDIMVHDYGPGREIVSFHAEVPANSNICKAHDVIDRLEQDMYNKFGCITTIHMDPIEVGDEKINEMKEMTEKIVKSIDPEFSIHDFRMTDGGERINLIFDLVITYEKNEQKAEIEKKVKSKIHKKDSRYYAVIRVENSFI